MRFSAQRAHCAVQPCHRPQFQPRPRLWPSRRRPMAQCSLARGATTGRTPFPRRASRASWTCSGRETCSDMVAAMRARCRCARLTLLLLVRRCCCCGPWREPQRVAGRDSWVHDKHRRCPRDCCVWIGVRNASVSPMATHSASFSRATQRRLAFAGLFSTCVATLLFVCMRVGCMWRQAVSYGLNTSNRRRSPFNGSEAPSARACLSHSISFLLFVCLT